MHDVRGREDAFTLDGQGFQFVHWPSAEKEFVDEEAIRTRYYAEVEALLLGKYQLLGLWTPLLEGRTLGQ